MPCVFFSKSNEIVLESEIELIKLTAVPFVNATFYAKMRIMKNRSSIQRSPCISVGNNEVNWNSKYAFKCKAYRNPLTNTLEPVNLKISIRKERGGNSYTKVGFVIINLSCFAQGMRRPEPVLNGHQNQQNKPGTPPVIAGAENVGSSQVIRRKYILEAYGGKNSSLRQDNSMLVVSIKISTNEKYFITPDENISKCVFMDEDDKNAQTHSKDDPKASNTTAVPAKTSEVQPVLPKIPSANQIPEQSRSSQTTASNTATNAPTSNIQVGPISVSNSHFQHSRNSSSESSSIHYMPRTLSDINPKQQTQLAQKPGFESILGNIKNSDDTAELRANITNLPDIKPKSPTSPISVISTTASSTYKLVGKPHKVQSTRSPDLVSQVLQAVPSITVDCCNDSNHDNHSPRKQIITMNPNCL